MPKTIYVSILSLLICASLSLMSHAQAPLKLSSAQSELNSLSSSIGAKQEKLQKLRKSADKKQATLRKAEAELDTAQSNLKAAQQNLAAQPNDSDAKRMQTKQALEAQRLEKSIVRHRKRADKAIKELLNTQKQIAKDKQRSDSLAEKIITLKQQAKTSKQAKQKRQVAKAKAAKAKPKKVVKKVVPKKPTVVKQVPQEKADWPTYSKADARAVEFAKNQLAQLDALKKSGKIGSPLLKKVSIKGSLVPMNNVLMSKVGNMGKLGEVVGKVFDGKLDYVGKDLYRINGKVTSGAQAFKVMSQNFHVDIPKQDNGAIYIFIYDVTSISKPRLILFNSALLK